MANVLITICAREGSKGIPNKNLKKLNGKPLIIYTLELAIKFAEQFDADIGISTDSDAISDIVSAFGIQSDYERPAYTATDEAGKLEAITDLKNHWEEERGSSYDYVLDMDVTSPLRNLSDLTRSFEMISADDNALSLFSVSPASRNPYFNMVEKGEEGYYSLVKERGEFYSRQSVPEVFDLNASFYFISKMFFTAGLKSVCTSRSLAYEVPHICFDIDSMNDLEYMDFLIKENKLDFEF